MSWSREQCETLIDAYQRFPCLYAVKTKVYRNKHARQSALEKIQEPVRSVRPNVTIAEIKTKIGGMRSNFLVEYRKWNASKNRSGASEDAVYKPTIWYFKKFFFILDHVQVRNTIDSLDIDEDSQETQPEPELKNDDHDELADEEVNTEIIGDLIVNKEGYLTNPERTSKKRQISSSSCNENGASLKKKQPKDKNPPDQIPDSDLMKEAFNALAVISSTIKTRRENSTPKCNKNEALANFIVTKLDQIVDEDIRLDIEEEITIKLYEAIKRSRNRIME